MGKPHRSAPSGVWMKGRGRRRSKTGRRLWQGTVVMPWHAEHEPDDLCGGRRLAGAEFERRKAELEKADREDRLKKAADPWLQLPAEKKQ